ncbi:MAG: class I SAM-dependent methyltransferase [Flavobacteriaceae bacterium]|nr:class I SAM-dependent methyltransferase [Flavobacteriaceae bacterium]
MIIEDYNYTKHWDKKYTSTNDEDLGWYEAAPEMTMRLVSKCALSEDAKILSVGAGTTTLIDVLIEEGYNNIIANDLSKVALEKLDERIVNMYGYNLKCITDDLTRPKRLNKLTNVDLWIDRAVLHFFLEQKEQQAYFDLIKQTVSRNGFVLIAVFALDGAQKCCNLNLKRYDVNMLQEQLGNAFHLVETFNHVFINPNGGERPYVYGLFQRKL